MQADAALLLPAAGVHGVAGLPHLLGQRNLHLPLHRRHRDVPGSR